MNVSRFLAYSADIVGNAMIVALVALLAISPAQAVPAGAVNGTVDAVAHEVDQHQVVYGSVYGYGNNYVFTISNGARFEPLHLNVHFQFIGGDGKLIGEIVRYGWCPASLGGSAKRCDVRFTAGGAAVYRAATIIKMFGERTGPQGGQGPRDGLSDFTVPILRGQY
jgi:hypothetical protein